MRSRFALAGGLVTLALLFAVTPVFAGGSQGRSSERTLTDAANGNFDVLEQANQYAEARTAPADEVDAGAFSSAYGVYKTMAVTPGTWNEVTNKPYDSDAHNYRDPVWSNSGGGAQHVAGRMTALALDGSTLYAGAADGGVWKKVGNGAWQPLTDDAPTLSIGALLVDPSHGLWVGTGEANTSSDSYAGIGVLYSADGGAHFSRVGGDELNNHTIGRLAYTNGFVLAATSRGLFRHSAATTSGAWTAVLAAGVGLPSACSQAGGVSGKAFVSDVAVKPGTAGNVVDAVVGWRAGSNCNGFFESTNGGQTFSPVAVSGAINDNDLGRVTIAWAANGSKVYAVVQSAGMFNHPRTDLGGTLLQGIYESDGSFAGPWNKVAEWRNLEHTGSALGNTSKGYHPGVQAWYNQFLAVDPQNVNHVFLGLEEVFESTDGAHTWRAAGPYWNFGLPCSANGLDSCPPTTHPDQHAVAIGNGKVYDGNDGGVYVRSLNSSASFASLNDGLNTLQYYYADAGPVSGGDAFWGGLQDNGESLLNPGASTMVSPFGGDGGDTLVDHTNGNHAVVEYVGLDMALTTNGGVSSGAPGSNSFREITPSCSAFTYTPSPCDPNPRFIAPFEADATNPSHWIAGGEFVWDNQNKGWDTTCGASSCDWKIVGDTGAGHSTTQVSVANNVWYAAWCGPCNTAGFARGILTNYGGTVHQLSLPAPPAGNVPNRFIQGLYVEPNHPNHVYAVFNGFSRRWTNTFSAGEGHVFESSDGGATWTDISGNLPDAPGDDIVLTSSGRLVLASDIGVMVSSGPHGGTWTRLGTNLPNASVNDLQLSPNGSYIIAATHGRGIWTIPTP
ncbi:MAG: hypothetical protein WBB74_03610 [Gaiellaceae bacterium]